MRVFLAPLLAVSLMTTALAGCGQVATPMATGLASTVEAQGKQGARLAKDFAALVKPRFEGQVSVKGSVVTVKGGNAEATRYDFSQVARTGLVRVSAGEASFEVRHADLIATTQVDGVGADALPALLVPIAIHAAIGGSVALAQYYLTHRDNFDRDEAIKAVVTGMAIALAPFVRDVQYAKYLVPVAIAILKNAKSLHYKDILAAAMDLKSDIIRVIIQMIKNGGHQPQVAV